jgi:hypothetical protein
MESPGLTDRFGGKFRILPRVGLQKSTKFKLIVDFSTKIRFVSIE